MRSNSLYYINPSTISLTPNCNGSYNDIAVYLGSSTKIKVYNGKIPGLGYDGNNSYREWTLTGRNRRLSDADGTTPFTIYARIQKSGTGAYLVFAKKEQEQDKYTSIKADSTDGNEYADYWYIKLGEVSAAQSGERTITLDTGILGTDQYNNEWQLEPDKQPLRVIISNDKDSGAPYLEWGDDITLAAHLVRGWDQIKDDMVHHWKITRDTGDEPSDNAWNDPQGDESGRVLADGDDHNQITLTHYKDGDDFNARFSATFHLTAWGSNPEYPDNPEAPEYIELANGDITILAETKEQFALVLSSDIVAYNPATLAYQPADGVKIQVRSISQNGTNTMMTTSAIANSGLSLFYENPIEPSSSSDPDSSDSSSSDSSDSSEGSDYSEYLELLFDQNGVAMLPVSVFAQQKNIQLSLRRMADGSSEEVASATVGFVRDGNVGTPGGNTATIYLYKRSADAISTTGIEQTLYYKFTEKRLFTDPTCVNSLIRTNNGWTPDIPSGTDPLYVTAATAYSTSDTDTISPNEWVTPALMSKNGQQGNPGGHGVNTATLFVYKRSASAPVASDKPSAFYYCFANGQIYLEPDVASGDASSQLGEWQRTIPTGDGNPCYVRQAVALSASDFDAIEAGDWSDAVKLVEDGQDGDDGADGVTYRCRWQLSGTEVATLAANADGTLKNVNSQNPALTATLMKRVGSGSESIAQGSGKVVFSFTGNNTSNTKNVFAGNMTSSINAVTSPANTSAVRKVLVTFSFTGGESMTFSIDKVFDGTPPTISIDPDSKNWIINGNDTGIKAEGENGTGVALKGTVSQINDLSNISGVSVGDCYVVNANRHLYFYNGTTTGVSGVPDGWTDLGEFKGADGHDGLSSYMHIAYATDIIFGSDSSSSDSSSSDSSSSDDDELVPVSANGFTTDYFRECQWIGFCTDNSPYDPTNFLAYKWNYIKGTDGNGYEYVYMRAKSETVPTIDEESQDGTRTRIDDEYWPAVANYDSSIFAGQRFTDDPQGVSETWPCEYQAVRKKVNGAWQPFSAATLHRKYGQDGNDGESPYVAALDTDTAVVNITGQGHPNKPQTIYAVLSLNKGGQACQPTVSGIKRNGNNMTWNALNMRWIDPSDSGLTVTYAKSTGLIAITYGTSSTITGKDKFTFIVEHMDGSTLLFQTTKAFTVAAIGRDTYTLKPSQSQILVKRTSGGFIPSTFSLQCGYQKTDIDGQVTQELNVTGTIDGIYNLYFRRHKREQAVFESEYHIYAEPDSSSSSSDSSDSSSSDEMVNGQSSMVNNLSVSEWDAVEFILCKNTAASVAPADVTGQVASAAVPVLIDGSVGATGPSYYYLGEWADQDSPDYIPAGTEIETTAYERPFISYTVGGETLYYLFIYPTGITAPEATEQAPRYHPDDHPGVWEPMQSQNKYIIAKAIFSKYGRFGNAIFNNDWLLSANGHIGNTEFTATDRISIVTTGSNSTELVVPHTLFDVQNPTKDGDQIYQQTFDVSEGYLIQASQDLKKGIVTESDLAFGDSFSLEAGKTYYVITTVRTSSTPLGSATGTPPHFWLRLVGGGTFNITDLITDNHPNYITRIVFFRVATSGNYSFSITHTPTHRASTGESYKYGNLYMDKWSFGVARFVPRYAVDLLTGMVIQGYGFTSGAQRRAKTIIDNSTFGYYTKPAEGNAGYSELNLESCGTFVEIRDGYWPLLQLPVFCKDGQKLYYDSQNTASYRDYTEEDRDYARSFVGTKLLIYITNGGIRCNYYWYGRHGDGNTDDWSTGIRDGYFVYRQSKDGDSEEANAKYFKTQEIEQGKFVELECMTGLDTNGYEIVYWNVNKIGNIAGWTQQGS